MQNSEQKLQFQATQEEPTTPEIVPAEAQQYIDNWGLIGIMIIIVLEMATPIGILFPTDAIVFGGGMYFSSKGTIPGGIWTIMSLFSLAVIAGDVMGFWRGKMLAPKIQTMKDSRYFKRKWITMCEKYFEEYGNKTMIVSKFLPIRSMVPIVAGVIQKPTIPYVLQSTLSAILWVGSLLGASYFIIWLIPSAINHIGVLTFLFVVLPQIGSIWYALLPMYRKYEKKLVGASENLQNIKQQFGHIGKEFASIGGEVKTIFTKIIEKDPSEIEQNVEGQSPDVIITPIGSTEPSIITQVSPETISQIQIFPDPVVQSNETNQQVIIPGEAQVVSSIPQSSNSIEQEILSSGTVEEPLLHQVQVNENSTPRVSQ